MKQISLKLITMLCMGLTVLQGMIATMPFHNPNNAVIAGGILMFLSITATAWKQYFSTEISNSSLIPTLIIAITATVGGANELINAVPVDPNVGHWIRFALTAATAILSNLSKDIFPATDSKKN